MSLRFAGEVRSSVCWADAPRPLRPVPSPSLERELACDQGTGDASDPEAGEGGGEAVAQPVQPAARRPRSGSRGPRGHPRVESRGLGLSGRARQTAEPFTDTTIAGDGVPAC